MDLNKVMLIGRLTNDPEMRSTPQGTAVTTFSIATNLVWMDQSGQKQEKVEYHNVVAWRKLAEICGQYLQKGRQVYVEGRLQTRSWEDPNGGKKYKTEVVIDNMIMLGSKGDLPPKSSAPSKQPTDQQPSSDNKAQAQDDEIQIENIPF